MKKNEHASGASNLHNVPRFRPLSIYSFNAIFSGGVSLYTEVFLICCPGIKSILWSHGWFFGNLWASSSENTFLYLRNSEGISLVTWGSDLANVVDTVVFRIIGSKYRSLWAIMHCDASMPCAV